MLSSRSPRANSSRKSIGLRSISAGFENPLHRVGLRPKELLPFLIGGAQVAGAADATLRGNPVWKFLEDHIGTIESSHILERAQRFDSLKILTGDRGVRHCQGTSLLFGIGTQRWQRIARRDLLLTDTKGFAPPPRDQTPRGRKE